MVIESVKHHILKVLNYKKKCKKMLSEMADPSLFSMDKKFPQTEPKLGGFQHVLVEIQRGSLHITVRGAEREPEGGVAARQPVHGCPGFGGAPELRAREPRGQLPPAGEYGGERRVLRRDEAANERVDFTRGKRNRESTAMKTYTLDPEAKVVGGAKSLHLRLWPPGLRICTSGYMVRAAKMF